MLEVGLVALSFEPDGKINETGNETINFIDNGTNMLCTLRNNGGLGLTCKSLESDQVISLRTKDKGATKRVKFSPNKKLVMFHRQSFSVDIVIVNTTNAMGSVEFSVNSKYQEPLIAVEWLNDSQLLLVSKKFMELVTINEAKQTYKLQKSAVVASSWCIFYAKCNICILGDNRTIQPVVINQGQFHMMKKFEIDFAGPNENIPENDVLVTTLYGKLYVMVFKCNSSNGLTDLVLYELATDDKSASTLKHTLTLGFEMNGIGINIIDNLVIVHHQPSRKSKIFDINLSTGDVHDAIVTTSITASDGCTPAPALYSRMWKIFQPYAIADSMMGVMYKLIIQYDKAENCIEDKFVLIHFLMNRSNQTSLTISTLLGCVKKRELSLRKLGKLFALIAEVSSAPDKANETSNAKKVINVVYTSPLTTYFSQQTKLISGFFIPLKDDLSEDSKYVGDIMLQYLNALHKAETVVDDYFLELLVQTLADAGELTTLHQLVTYRVISDLKPLASLLLGYEARCKQLFQSGVDILCRQKGITEIIEVLLSKGLVIDAVRFLDSPSGNINYSHAKLIEAANRKNRFVQYAVVSHLASKKGKSAEITSFTEDEIKGAEREVALNILYD
ncbi:unnamed protein product [Auanema sp. JU1783]|nr:unnamed protein product [Auanema sp. JU1783]